MTSLKKLLPSLALGIAAIPAFAGDEPVLDKADTAWIMIAGLLVLFMTIPGIALFYAGMVRKKNMLSTLAQSVAICGLMSILWYAVGYSLAFSEGTPLSAVSPRPSFRASAFQRSRGPSRNCSLSSSR